MAGMADKPDGYYDLAVVDPPYGIGEDGESNHSRGSLAKPTLYAPKDWDKNAPDSAYFDLLNRKAQKIIIWGANHFISRIPFDSPCWLVWNKLNGENDFADCELAYTNFKTSVRMFTFRWAGMLQGNMKDKETRIHPTQKPVALYDWIFKNYAKPGMKILDTHVGSGSSRIAADKAGLSFEGWELDPDYYAGQEKRYKLFKKQLRLNYSIDL